MKINKNKLIGWLSLSPLITLFTLAIIKLILLGLTGLVAILMVVILVFISSVYGFHMLEKGYSEEDDS